MVPVGSREFFSHALQRDIADGQALITHISPVAKM
jgi:hypothetical protein